MWKRSSITTIYATIVVAALLLFFTNTAAAAAATQSIATPIPVVGVKTGIDKKTGQPPPRLDINDLYARGGPQWDLYILALSQMQNQNETEETSFFSIAGIHGHPHTSWNGVEHVDGAPYSGFCPHGELLFATWHRPYVALFEQILVANAQLISLTYPPSLRPAYISAAQTLRQPYWDWALSPFPILPPAVTYPNLTVISPLTGQAQTIDNPLYQYKFQRPRLIKSWGGHLSSHSNHTLRCINSGDDDYSDSDDEGNNATASNENLRDRARGLSEYVYDIFTRVTTFDEMKTTTFETPHNMIHAYAACDGTLSDLNWAGFEPLFMLHHANIDRLLALWQTIWYNNNTTDNSNNNSDASNMFTGTDISKGQFATPKGTIISASSPLKPFFQQDGISFHTSNSVQNWYGFGYTYPELPPLGIDEERGAEWVRAEVNSLYGPGKTGDKDGVSRIGGGEGKKVVVEVSVNRKEFMGKKGRIGFFDMGGRDVGEVVVMNMPCEGELREVIPLTGGKIEDGILEVGVWFEEEEEIDVGRIKSLNITIWGMEYLPGRGNSGFPIFDERRERLGVEVRGRKKGEREST
ncbi:hypothetical protein QBC38DRAFT_540616 [Podospora fimiseda]|uniref:Tyrosinase copper-binding domain-containing protein n=1 Tax=Podospora fimiseda TaxID=252190 RepID=A0AAN7C0V6_9PEZI|nr:hypothetical protein QBC38DRAFT_540616 [Podospora fimiseda]